MSGESRMKRSRHREGGFGLMELTVVIIVAAVLMAVAMQSMTVVVQHARQTKTEREMEMLARAIVGDPSLTSGGRRSDFGYVGDIGAFPTDLQALYRNPGGYGTWDGPYIDPGLLHDSTGFKMDEWGMPYTYTGGLTITSTGSGGSITGKIADAVTDYTLNTLNGTITDANDSVPGTVYTDSVDIKVTIPNGSGSTITKTYSPDSSGSFTLDSLPVGTHPLRLIYTPNVDTLLRYVTILPRHKSTVSFKFASAYFSGGSGGGGGTYTLRPDGSGWRTNLTRSGCSNNWQCVDEIIADDDASRVIRASNQWAADYYTLDDPGGTSGSITKVTVCARAKRAHTQGGVRLCVFTHGSPYQGTYQGLSTSYEIYSEEWTTNPNTSAAWTWTEINNLQAGVRMRGQNSSFPAYCTQVWVEVEYSN